MQLINFLGSSGSDVLSVLSSPLTANEDWVSYRRMKTKNASMTSSTKMTYTGMNSNVPLFPFTMQIIFGREQ